MELNRGPVILIVDDSPSIRYEVKAILEKEGYIVRVAGNEIGMFNAIDEYGRLADLIIMDLTLQETHGFELISKLSSFEAYKRIPVAVLTEHADRNNVSTAKTMGVKGYIAKPINPDLLKERIKNILVASGKIR
ncbi:MAG: response regulator [Clostridia bacterium]|nr:response regulator [Clostridia bacterium]